MPLRGRPAHTALPGSGRSTLLAAGQGVGTQWRAGQRGTPRTAAPPTEHGPTHAAVMPAVEQVELPLAACREQGAVRGYGRLLTRGRHGVGDGCVGMGWVWVPAEGRLVETCDEGQAGANWLLLESQKHSVSGGDEGATPFFWRLSLVWRELNPRPTVDLTVAQTAEPWTIFCTRKHSTNRPQLLFAPTTGPKSCGAVSLLNSVLVGLKP